MNNQYEQKVTALIAAADELLSVLPHDSNALQTVKDEIEALQAACRAINVPTETDQQPVFVEVRGGCVVDVYDELGNRHAKSIIIDHDSEESGECPACGFEFNDEEPCEECGYSAAEDNALECAVKHFSTAWLPEVIHTSEAPEVDEETVTLIVASYDWECPHCSVWNTVQDNPEKVTCEECGHTYIVDSAVHIGK